MRLKMTSHRTKAKVFFVKTAFQQKRKARKDWFQPGPNFFTNKANEAVLLWRNFFRHRS